ncbi:putative C6 finger domain protein [Paraphoma chrysanthemicola]|uniref:C6 finger domain protein n=1 Tax=Paraphoma chrysanthemicola TaxID=798071 RepID=A0A8K0QU02_9PLEO|nr:putative C6 finger domain protein [Paraphoma chrysanthemicola]
MARHTRASNGHAVSSDVEGTNVTTKRIRRTHRKSRNGCMECKNCHIRCDERRPCCANCEAAERTCSVGQSHSHSPHSQFAQHNALPSITDLDPTLDQAFSPPSTTQVGDVHSPPVPCLPGLLSFNDTVPQATFTSQHIILLRHADRVPDMTGPGRNAVDVAIRRAVDSPYLLDEILAFTAFHLAYVYPGSAPTLRHLATELQNRALTSFTSLTKAIPNDDKATGVPRFLFSAILGRHVLADALAYHSSDFHAFIDRFVECINLNRGVRAVTPPARQFLFNSELRPFLNVVIEAQSKITSPGNECDPLIRLMDISDLSATSANACRQAVTVLQQSFDVCRHLDEADYSQSASAFSVTIEAGFVDMLRKHQPEALVILAYFGVLLHRCRSFWAFGEAGGTIVRAAAGHLGSYWQEALAWPLHVLETEHSPKLANLVSGSEGIPVS